MLLLIAFVISLITFTPPQQSSAEKIVRVEEDGIRKSASRTVMPSYPTKSLNAKKQGIAVVKLEYDGAGNPRNLNVLESPDEHIREAVLQAVRQWRFKPSTYRGEPLVVTGKLTFYFTLNKKGQGFVENPRQFR